MFQRTDFTDRKTNEHIPKREYRFHTTKTLSTANTVVFPGFCQMISFAQTLFPPITTLQEIPLHITFFAILLCSCLFEKSILTLTIHLSFLFPQCLYLIFFYYPILFLTSQNTSKTHTPLEMASSSEKQELRYSPTLVSHISDQKDREEIKLDNPELHTFPSKTDFISCSPSTAKCKALFTEITKYI